MSLPAQTTYQVSVPRRTGHNPPSDRRGALYESVPGQAATVIGSVVVACDNGGPSGTLRATARDGRVFETFGGWNATAHAWISSAREVPPPAAPDYDAEIRAALGNPKRLRAAVLAVLNRHVEHVDEQGTRTGTCAWCDEDYPCVTVLDIHDPLMSGIANPPGSPDAGEGVPEPDLLRSAKAPAPSHGNAVGSGGGAAVAPRSRRGARDRK